MSQRNISFEFWSAHTEAILRKLKRENPKSKHLKAFLKDAIANIPKLGRTTGDLGGDPHLETLIKIRLRKRIKQKTFKKYKFDAFLAR